jgi:orotate phosphoribosyltransferase
LDNLRQQFIEFSVKEGVLEFGKFITKAGRISPYFFNAGTFSEGAILGKLARFYAQTLINSTLKFDMLFGPAYKGITLASATAVALASKGQNKRFSYNRKESKIHGEGGNIVGGPLRDRVLIIDDVISAGTSVFESAKMIEEAGATLCGIVIALDRMERSGKDEKLSSNSAVEEIKEIYNVPVISICNLVDLLDYLSNTNSCEGIKTHYAAVENYRNRYGIV